MREGVIVAAEVQFFNDGPHVLAIKIPADFRTAGIEFFTQQDASQQLGYMRRPRGYLVQPHWHRQVNRTVRVTQEVLLVRSGECRLDLFGIEGKFVESVILGPGDVVWLGAGGHGLEMLEESEIIEVKQGPYAGDQDKVRFSPDINDSR